MLVSSGRAEDGHAISPGVWGLTWRVARGWHCKVPAIQIRVTRVPWTPRMRPAHDVNLHTHVKYFWQSQLTEFWSRGQEKYGDRKSWNWRKNQHYQPHDTTTGVITSRFGVNIELPCKILDFQMTAPRASLCCCDSDWHPMRTMGQGKHFDARCWSVEEISGVSEVEWVNGIDSATKIMRSKVSQCNDADLPLPVTSMTCRRVLILTHQGTGHYPPSTEMWQWSNNTETQARMWLGLF